MIPARQDPAIERLIEEVAEADIAEDEEPPLGECPGCGALNYSIGSLGPVAHFTCRHCGLWYH